MYNLIEIRYNSFIRGNAKDFYVPIEHLYTQNSLPLGQVAVESYRGVLCASRRNDDMSTMIYAVERRGPWHEIIAIFSEEDSAKVFCAIYNEGTSDHKAYVKTYELDVYIDYMQDMRPYFIQMTKNGTVTNIYVIPGAKDYEYPLKVRENTYISNDRSIPESVCLSGIVQATDIEKAIEIANKKRSELLIANQWIVSE